jgi:tetratricopeptide (TPR) repeat protein
LQLALAHLCRQSYGDGRDDVDTGYAWMSRYTLKFLDAYLKHDQAAVAFLKQTPADNGVPRHVMEVTYRAAHGTPASFDGLRRAAGKRGFAELPQIYAEMVKERPDFKPDEFLLSDWGTELIDEGHFPEAIEVLRLGSDLYPGSGAGYQLLGDAYRAAGQRNRAIEAYRKALELNALDGAAKRKLAAVQGEH